MRDLDVEVLRLWMGAIDAANFGQFHDVGKVGEVQLVSQQVMFVLVGGGSVPNNAPTDRRNLGRITQKQNNQPVGEYCD